MLSTLRLRFSAGRRLLRTASSLFTTHPSPSTRAHLHTSHPHSLDVSGIIGPDNVVKSPLPDIDLPKEDLYTCVFKDFAKYGSKVALVHGETGREYTFNEIDESTSKFSSSLRRHGFQPGDVLAVVSPNIPEYASLVFGTLAAGGAVSTCNTTYSSDELAYQFKNSGSKIVATIPDLLHKVKEAAEKANISRVIVVDTLNPPPHRGTKGLLSYTDMVTDSGSLFSPVKRSPDDLAMLPYSSGTTGLPKGVMLTNLNVASSIQQMQHPEILDRCQEGTCIAGVLPFFHIAGMVVILYTSLQFGAKTVTMSKFEPELFLSSIEKYKITQADLVPPLVLFLAKHPLVDNYNLSSINKIGSGAAPLGGDIVKAVQERIGCDLIVQAYGLTETSGCTHIMPRYYGMNKPDSVGHPVCSMLAKIVSPETGESLPAGEEGELWLSGSNIMKGYLNLPEVTRDCITDDGWFKSGDMGRYDNDGSFYITDRLKELIKVKGFQVAPAELEAVLVSHHKISDAAVTSVPDERQGEAPRAFVVKKEGDLTEKEVMEYMAVKLAPHKQLTGGVKFVDAVPKSASGKILRRLLKDM